MRELCDSVAEHAGMPDAESLFAAVRDREALAGTATGGEIAIPHARLPKLPRPVLTIGRSLRGIEWDAPDGQPVHLVFLLLTPVREHGLQLQILAALARAMSDVEARGRVLRADSEQAMWSALEDALRAQQLVRVKLEGPAAES